MKKYTKKDLWANLILSLVLIATTFILVGIPIYLKIIIYSLALISTALFLQGILIISNNPSSFAVITKWGERAWNGKDENDDPIVVIAEEGWVFLFLRGFVYGDILISNVKRENDFNNITLITPDNGKTDVSVGIAYVPNRRYSLNYLNLGENQKQRDEMVTDWFDNILTSELRQWATSKTEGPMTWEKLIAAKDETTDMLIDKIVGATLDADQKKNLKRGRCKITIKNMGIDLVLLNLTTMKPFGPVYDASVVKNTEEKERKSETYEVGTDLQKAKKLRADLDASGVKMSLEACMDKIMAWKIQREANKQISVSSLAAAFMSSFKNTGGK